MPEPRYCSCKPGQPCPYHEQKAEEAAEHAAEVEAERWNRADDGWNLPYGYPPGV